MANLTFLDEFVATCKDIVGAEMHFVYMDCKIRGKTMKVMSEMKNNWITVALLATFIGTTYFIQNTNNSLRNLVVLSDGLQTCTTRVSQTYTAKLIGDTTSPYAAPTSK